MRLIAGAAALGAVLAGSPAAAHEESVEERRFVNAQFGGCLDASSGDETLAVMPCSAEAGDYQVWITIQSDLHGGPMQIINKANGYCLEGYLPLVLQEPCYGSQNPTQQWNPVIGDGGAMTFENVAYPGRMTQRGPSPWTIGLSTDPLDARGLWVR